MIVLHPTRSDGGSRIRKNSDEARNAKFKSLHPKSDDFGYDCKLKRWSTSSRWPQATIQEPIGSILGRESQTLESNDTVELDPRW